MSSLQIWKECRHRLQFYKGNVILKTFHLEYICRKSDSQNSQYLAFSPHLSAALSPAFPLNALYSMQKTP